MAQLYAQQLIFIITLTLLLCADRSDAATNQTTTTQAATSSSSIVAGRSSHEEEEDVNNNAEKQEDIPCRRPVVSKVNRERAAQVRHQQQQKEKEEEEEYAAARRRQRQQQGQENQPSAASDSDGIVRKDGCRAECEMCCDGKCCEEIDPTIDPDFDFDVATHQIWIPIRFVLITDQREVLEKVTLDKINEQIGILNHAFNMIHVWFYTHSFLVIDDDPRMVSGCNTDPCYIDEETCDFYEYIMPRVRLDGGRVVTYIMCGLTYLGEAQLPWAEIEDHRRQYVQTHYKVLGYGSEWYRPEGGGMGVTGIHEMGHFFGLLHVFEQEYVCDTPDRGDYVEDTPTARIKASREQGCDDRKDSCPSSHGVDPDNNWMNYGRDECSTHFTPLQYERIRRVFRKYRPRLYANSLVAGSCHRDVADGNILAHCRCHNRSRNPLYHCREDSADAPPTVGVTGFLYAEEIDKYRYDDDFDTTYNESSSNNTYAFKSKKASATGFVPFLYNGTGDGWMVYKDNSTTKGEEDRSDDHGGDGLTTTQLVALAVGSSVIFISFLVACVCTIRRKCCRRKKKKRGRGDRKKNKKKEKDDDDYDDDDNDDKADTNGDKMAGGAGGRDTNKGQGHQKNETGRGREKGNSDEEEEEGEEYEDEDGDDDEEEDSSGVVDDVNNNRGVIISSSLDHTAKNAIEHGSSTVAAAAAAASISHVLPTSSSSSLQQTQQTTTEGGIRKSRRRCSRSLSFTRRTPYNNKNKTSAATKAAGEEGDGTTSKSGRDNIKSTNNSGDDGDSFMSSMESLMLDRSHNEEESCMNVENSRDIACSSLSSSTILKGDSSQHQLHQKGARATAVDMWVRTGKYFSSSSSFSCAATATGASTAAAAAAVPKKEQGGEHFVTPPDPAVSPPAIGGGGVDEEINLDLSCSGENAEEEEKKEREREETRHEKRKRLEKRRRDQRKDRQLMKSLSGLFPHGGGMFVHNYSSKRDAPPHNPNPNSFLCSAIPNPNNQGTEDRTKAAVAVGRPSQLQLNLDCSQSQEEEEDTHMTTTVTVTTATETAARGEKEEGDGESIAKQKETRKNNKYDDDEETLEERKNRIRATEKRNRRKDRHLMKAIGGMFDASTMYSTQRDVVGVSSSSSSSKATTSKRRTTTTTTTTTSINIEHTKEDGGIDVVNNDYSFCESRVILERERQRERETYP